jgi:hypothetical protein
MTTFRDTIIGLLNEFIEICDNDIERQHAEQWVVNLPDELILPIGTSTNKDPKTMLIDNFKWFLEYGSIHYCLIDKSYAWFPFIISYNWCRKVTMYLVNLVTKQLSVKEILPGGDCSPFCEYKVRYLINRHSDFILPTRDYSYTYEDQSLFEAEFKRIDIEGDILYLDDDIYRFDVHTKQYYYNETVLDPEDEDGDALKIGTFIRFTTFRDNE